jgi:hypothetical protein
VLTSRATSQRGGAVRSVAGAVLGVLVAVLLVAAAAVLGTAIHQVAYSVGGVRAPVGLLLALALTGLVAALVRSFRSLLVRVVAVLTWLFVIGGLVRSTPGGDVLVPANLRGYGWLLGGFVVLLAVLLVPGRAAGRRRG